MNVVFSDASDNPKLLTNPAGHAWYLEGGEPRFLAAVPGGFAWPAAPSEVD